MKVLDIDLDFFLADCCEPAPAGARPDAAPAVNAYRQGLRIIIYSVDCCVVRLCRS